MKPLAKLLNTGDIYQEQLYKHQEDFASNRLYIVDKASVRTIDLRNGRMIKKHLKEYVEPVMDFSSTSPFHKKVVEAFDLQAIMTEEVRPSQNNNASQFASNFIVNTFNEEITRVNILNDKNITLWKVKQTKF